MSTLPGRIASSATLGTLAGLALGGIHAAVLASGGSYDFEAPARIIASFARHAGLLGLIGAVFGAGFALASARLPRRIRPGLRLVVPALALLYLIPWMLVLAKEHGLRSSLPAMAGAGAAVFVLGLAVFVLAPRVLGGARAARPSAGQPAPEGLRPTAERGASPSTLHRPRLGRLGALLLLAAGLYSLPFVVGRPSRPADSRLVFADERLDTLRTPAAARFRNERWNVLLLTIDALRADHLGCYGYDRPTSPAIDRRAAEGMRFDRAYCPRPKTSASFATLFTGLFPRQNGVYQCRTRLEDRYTTMAEIFRAAGWRTAAVVTNGNLFPQFGFDQGFEEFFFGHSLAAEGNARALTWLSNHAADAQPWFLWIHHIDPHKPYTPPAPYDEMFGRGAAEGDRHQRKIDLYDGEVRYTDEQVGLLFDWLAASPAARRTLVIVTADHGESLGEHGIFYEHGPNPYEPSARVPLFFWAPGTIPAGSCPAVVNLIDLLPTLLDVVGMPSIPMLPGRSLLPNAAGLTELGAHDFTIVFAGDNWRAWPGLTCALRRADTKYVRRLRDWAILPRDPHAFFWTYNAFVEGALGGNEYFDLTADPGEERNLIESRRDATRSDHQALERFLADLAGTRSEGRQVEESEIAPETLELLRTLGYVK